MGAITWIEQYSREARYRISTTVPSPTTIARVKSYGDVLNEYEFHPEAKCADASGAPCDKQSVGLLQRRHVTIEWPPHFIGKESNKLEEVEREACRTSSMCIPSIRLAPTMRLVGAVAIEKLPLLTKSDLRA